MGTFSIWHGIVLLLGIGNLVGIIHIAVSPRTQGWQKAAWLVAALLVPFIPYLVWLISRPSAIDADAAQRVRTAQANALEAEALAREVEARVRIEQAKAAAPYSPTKSELNTPTPESSEKISGGALNRTPESKCPFCRTIIGSAGVTLCPKCYRTIPSA